MIAGLYHNPGVTAASIGAAEAVHSHAIDELPVAGSGETSAAKVVRADDARLDGGGSSGPHVHDMADVTGLTAALGARPLLASAAPVALAAAAQVGSGVTAARADHVHPLPSAADVGIFSAQLWQTGDYKHTAVAVAPSGWVFADGRSIGAAGSAATSRAHADTEALFTLLYDAYANGILPVSGGRGPNAASDFAAGKTIALPDLRGRALFGCDAMGGSAAGRITAAGIGNPGISGATLGAAGGTDRSTLTTAQMPSHAHGGISGASATQYFTTAYGAGGQTNLGTADNTVHTTASAGGGEAHPQMPPALICTILIKL